MRLADDAASSRQLPANAIANRQWAYLVHMLQQTAGGTHNDVCPTDAIRLLLHTLATDDEAGGHVVFTPHLAQHVENLKGKFSRGSDDNRSRAVVCSPALTP